MNPSVLSTYTRPVTGEEDKRFKKSVERLPFDCWGEILLFLGGYAEYNVIIQSVKGLYSYIKYQNTYCAKNLIFRLIDYPKRGIELRFVKQIQIGQRDYELPYKKSITNRILTSTRSSLIKRLFPFFPCLERLEINGYYFPKRDKHIIQLGKELKAPNIHLKRLCLRDNSNIQINIYFEKLPSLECLEIEHGKSCEIFAYGLSKEPPLKNLKELIIRTVDRKQTLIMNPVLVTILREQLVRLHLDNCDMYVHIIDFPVLERLQIGKDHWNETKIANLPKIKYIDLTSLMSILGNYFIDFSTINKKIEEIRFHTGIYGLNISKMDPEEINSVTPIPQHDKIEVTAKIFEQFMYLKTLCLDISFGYSIDHNEEIENNLTNPLVFNPLEFEKLPKSLETLAVRSRLPKITAKDLNGLKNLNVMFESREIVVDFETLKPNLESFSISCGLLLFKSREDRALNNNSNKRDLKKKTKSYFHIDPKIFKQKCEIIAGLNCKNNLSKNNNTLYFNNFIRLKKLLFQFEMYLFVDIEIRDCELLEYVRVYSRGNLTNEEIMFPEKQYQKNERISPNLPPKFRLTNLPRLKRVHFTNNTTKNTRIMGCPNLHILRIGNCETFPRGIVREKLTELVLRDCTRGVFENQTIDGKKFKSLKFLGISQRWERKDNSENDVCVKRIIGLSELWYLRIRSNFIQICGIEEVDGLSENVDVALKYKRGQDRSILVDRSMDKKRFMKFFETWKEKEQAGDIRDETYKE